MVIVTSAPEEQNRDPRGYVTVPPSVVVKVISTGRADLNGLLGIVVSFNVERERYLVHMCKSQSTMALKTEHLTKASVLESYRAQWEQLKNDARVKEKMSKYLNLCQKYVSPVKLSHAVVGVLALFVALIYSVGFLKTIMTTSLVLLIGAISAPDMTSGPQAVVRNFPERSRTVIEKQIPMLRGRLTNRIAVGVILVLVVVCAHSLTFHKPPTPHKHKEDAKHHKKANTRPKRPRAPIMDKAMLEQFYNMGYEDAVKERIHGSSLEEGLANIQLVQEHVLKAQKAKASGGSMGLEDMVEYFSNGEDEDHYYDDDDEDHDDHDDEEDLSTGRRRHKRKKKKKRKPLLVRMMSLTNLASMIYLYRSIVDLGTDQSTNLFSVGQLAANVQHHTEWWRKALLTLSLYNVLRIFV